jgi:hypothetical protein
MNRIKVASAFVTAILVVALLGLAPAAVGTNGGSGLFNDMKPLVEVYNENVGKVPLVTSLIGEERINGSISLNDGSVLSLAIMTDEDAKITSFQEGEISDPTINAYSDENTVRSIINSGDPVATFQNVLDTGTIQIEAVGMGGKIKIGLAKVALKIASFFI